MRPVVLSLLLAAALGCRPSGPSQPGTQPEPAARLPTDRYPQYLIADRETLIYHRQNCAQLPPPERRALVDPKMIEYAGPSSKPCPVCRPDRNGSPRQENAAEGGG